MKNVIEIMNEILDELKSDGNIVIKKSDLRKLFNIKRRSSTVDFKGFYVMVMRGLRSLDYYCDCGNHIELHKYYNPLPGCKKVWRNNIEEKLKKFQILNKK